MQPNAWIRRLVEQALRMKDDLPRRSDWYRYESAFHVATGSESFADDWVQAVACSRAAIGLIDEPLRADVQRVARESAGPLVAAVLETAETIPPVEAAAPTVSLTYFYERFLRSYNKTARAKRGIFFTPQPLVRFIVDRIDWFLRHEFELVDGLADTANWAAVAAEQPIDRPSGIGLAEPFVQCLDPAVGTGAFLSEVIQSIHSTLVRKWGRSGASRVAQRERWNDYIANHLLPRLAGVDLSLPALTIAQLNIANTLVSTGYRPTSANRIRLVLSDALANRHAETDGSPLEPGLAETELTALIRWDSPATVLLGNPPFSGMSANRGDWIRQLLRGHDGTDAERANYYLVDGKSLQERKLWLQDDYVKFIRYAHWRIERSGTGIVGLVTNHGYLDNATFRGMRAALLDTFPQTTVLDLHGNRKKQEIAPNQERDKNVFEIEQGVAVGLFRNPPTPRSPVVRHGELWGDSDRKLNALSRNEADFSLIAPASPHYFLTGHGQTVDETYHAGFRLNDIMPVNSTAVVTARDRFVIGWSRDELVGRLQRFRDLSIPDEEIRATLFTNGRSVRYPAGDTRGWKLSEARRRMAMDERYQEHIQTCLYRPFDRRPIFWAKWMIDWPRPEVMRHMVAGSNLALIARRQMLPSRPCSFFWVSPCVTIDGVIRSDNRGSESVFPLYLDSRSDENTSRTKAAVANFSQPFVDHVAESIELKWDALGGDLLQSFGPRDLLHYIYALFHSFEYRRRFASQLRIDFPRVLVTPNESLFRQLCKIGQHLVNAHTETLEIPEHELPELQGSCGKKLAAAYPRHRDRRILLNDDCFLKDVDERVWNYRVGGYQICRKWLRDRKSRELLAADLSRYRRIVWSIQATLGWMAEVDQQVAAAGGWPSAFAR
jgi:predicted helicase